jgi:N4-gp56 family major capsid protein
MAITFAGTTTQSANQNHLATVYYDRLALTRLTPQFRFYAIGSKRPVPQGVGKTIQFFRRNVPAYNTSPSAEGVIPAPFSNGTATISATVEQYSDYMSTSTMIEDTSITNEVEGMIEDLTIRAAGSVDTITRLEIDSNSSQITDTIGTNLAANDFKKRVGILAGQNVLPYENANYMAVTHPYAIYDIVVDTTTGGFIDALKYQQGQKVLDGEVGMVGSCRLLTSTNVGNDGTAAPNTKYNTYIFGKESFGCVDLTGRGPSDVTDPQKERFKVNVIKGGPSATDPTGEIGTYVSYRFVFAAKTFDKNRFQIPKAKVAIGL